MNPLILITDGEGNTIDPSDLPEPLRQALMDRMAQQIAKESRSPEPSFDELHSLAIAAHLQSSRSSEKPRKS
jgi:hypothetical protein